jgi:hypothetical protein
LEGELDYADGFLDDTGTGERDHRRAGPVGSSAGCQVGSGSVPLG